MSGGEEQQICPSKSEAIDHGAGNMGIGFEGDAMGQIQEQLHVEQRVPPATDQVHCLPMRLDLLRGI